MWKKKLKNGLNPGTVALDKFAAIVTVQGLFLLMLGCWIASRIHLPITFFSLGAIIALSILIPVGLFRGARALRRRWYAEVFGLWNNRAEKIGFTVDSDPDMGRCQTCWHPYGKIAGHGPDVYFCPDCGHANVRRHIVDAHAYLGVFEENPRGIDKVDADDVLAELRQVDARYALDRRQLMDRLAGIPGGMQRLEGSYRVAPEQTAPREPEPACVLNNDQVPEHVATPYNLRMKLSVQGS